MSLENKLFFSIVVPIFNTENYLRRCIESVLKQSFSSWELILVDDNSKDGSLAICQEYSAKYPGKIKFIKSELNEGQLKSREKGVTIANGEYVLYLDSDDFYSENTLDRIFCALTDKKTDLCSFNTNIISPDRIKGVKQIPFLDEEKQINDSSCLIQEYLCDKIFGYSCFFAIRRTVAARSFKDVEAFSYLRYTEDLMYLYFVFTHSNSCYQIQDKLYNYWMTENSFSNNKNLAKYKDRFDCYEFIYGNKIDTGIISDSVKLNVALAVLSYARELCKVQKKPRKQLKFISQSRIIKKFGTNVGFVDHFYSFLWKLLLRKHLFLLTIVVRWYHKKYEKV